MTLELKQYKSDFFPNSTDSYKLGGVVSVNVNTEYGEDTFAVTIFDTRIFIASVFEYVQDADTGEYFVKDGKWI